MSDFELVWDTRCEVAESPVWDAANQRIFFCDINGKRVYALSIDTNEKAHWDFPEVVGSIGLCRSGKLVVSQQHHVLLFDPRTGHHHDLTPKAPEPPTTRLNDGKVGPDGAFWVGSLDQDSPRRKIASLYRVTADGHITAQEGGYANSNGLAWSPDGKIMYHSDSTTGYVEAWDFDVATGGRSNHRIVVTLTNTEGRPDGAACDIDGNYWSAAPSAGCLNCFSPDGRLLRKWAFPVPGPTMPCFAKDFLYVTSLRDGKPAEVVEEFPGLGGLFRAPAPVKGAPVGLFAA